MRTNSLLVIDDDNALLYSIRKSLERPDLRVHVANSGSSGLQIFQDERPTVVLLDLRLNEASGLDVLKELRALDGSVPVIMFTAFSTTDATIEATKSGAFDYLLKPVDLGKLRDTVARAIASRRPSEVQVDLAGSFSGKGQRIPGVDGSADVNMVGSSPAMQQVYKQIGRFASSSANILILGESGTGKELVARAIHHHSGRRSEQFVAINCAALSETLLESELFGHERGAFTGADKRRVGKFEFANHGTIFLDEVADMSAATQAKLLRLLQDQQFERLGGNETIKTDVRIVAATNKSIEAMVAQGKFREDLYYRLNVFCVRVPPLRSRIEDLPELVSYFIGRYREEFNKDRVQVEQPVYELLSRYRWPGNMRELQSVVKYALAHAVGDVIGCEHLPESLLVERARPEGAVAAAAVRGPAGSLQGLADLAKQLLERGEGDVYGKSLAVLEQVILPIVLDHTGGNLQQACERLGLSRNTLKGKMRDHGIRVRHAVLSKNDGMLEILQPNNP